MEEMRLLEMEDPTGMISQVYNFLDDIEYAIREPIDFRTKFKNIAICGMGGSAIGGSILSNCAMEMSSMPVEVVDFPELPKWVGDHTLTIISTYSGNTYETLMMYDQAIERGGPIVVVSSGGEIEKRCEGNGTFMVKLKAGIQPRSAMGLTIGYMANIIESAGGPKFRTEIAKTLPDLYKLRNRLVIGDSKNTAVRVARKLVGKTPVIYASPLLSASAYRWKTQINENSKMMAFNGTIPDTNHNEIMGWTEGDKKGACQLLIFQEDESSKMMRRMVNVTVDTLRSKDVRPILLRIRGRSIAERSLRAIMIGDFVSLYLAYFNGVNPAEVAAINDFKSRFSALIEYMSKRKAMMRMGKRTSKSKR